MSNQAKSDPTMNDANKKNFTGLPIPASAAAAVSLNLLLVSEEFRSWFPFSELTWFWILFAALIFLGYLMISRWKSLVLRTYIFASLLFALFSNRHHCGG